MQRNKLPAVFFPALVVFLAASCNFNYFQGSIYEKNERYEEANIEYLRAFSSDPDDEDFAEAYKRTAKLTVDEIRERYSKLIPENRYLQAYDLMDRALVLEPENEFFRSEQKKWAKILVIGKVNLDLRGAGKRIGLYSKMEFMARVNTPNQDRLLRAEVNLYNGLISAVDFLYTPTDSFLALYSINSVGINPSSSLSGSRGFGLRAFNSFVNFGAPVLTKTTGSLGEGEGGYASVFEKSAQAAPAPAQDGKFFFPSSSIRYTAEFGKTDVKINSDSESIIFLPKAIYSNPEENTFILDFGAMNLKFFPEKDEWGIQRLANDPYLEDFSNYFALHPYFRKVRGHYPINKI